MIEFQGVIDIVKDIVDNEEFKEINNSNIPPKNKGVYIIKEKEKKLFNGNIFYIGCAKGGKRGTLDVRIVRKHLNGTSRVSILRKKLIEIKGLSNEKEVSQYLKNSCLFLIKPIKDFDKVLAVESLLILYFRNKVPELLNDYKK